MSGGLQTNIKFLSGVGEKRADLLKKELGIEIFQDLLYHFPFRHIDRSQFYLIKDVIPTMSEVQIVGVIKDVKQIGQYRGKRLVAILEDQSGSIQLVWFQSIEWVKKNIKIGETYVIFGKPTKYGTSVNIAHPDIELKSEYMLKKKGNWQPVYNKTEKLISNKINDKQFMQFIRALFEKVKFTISESLSTAIISQHSLLDKKEALFRMHFPNSRDQLERAKKRLKFEELFFLQLLILIKKQNIRLKVKGFRFEQTGKYVYRLYENHLPFSLTKAQKRVIKEIRKNMNTGHQMNRLLQGDVGSGKTIVAFMSILIALGNGFQSCFMAPTEILAQQHYNSIQKFAVPLNIKIDILTGSTKAKKRKELFKLLKEGEIDILIGTHALIEGKVVFKNLGLAIIDEQHKFGVAQRAKLWEKNSKPPHILVMTATPIPRTMAMSVYGDLDVSIIDELPPNRPPVKTIHQTDKNRLKIFHFLRKEIQKGRQVYIVYPLVKESETLDLKDVIDGYESISREFGEEGYHISIVHGQMKSKAKQYEMGRFKKGETQILVSTIVVEVGIDVPNATVMVIENAERFGLSQLHQLRGRIGRGSSKSYCVLMTKEDLSEDAKMRISAMVSTNDGFEIAEIDLKIRGPGDLMGTQQSGSLPLKIADLVEDYELMKQARESVFSLLKHDPKLEKPQNANIKKTYENHYYKKSFWGNIS